MNIDLDLLAYWSKLVTIFLLSIVKYGLGMFTAVNLDIGFLPSIIANLAGGAIGLILFINFGKWIMLKYYAFKYKNKTHRRFSSWNKFLLKVRKRMGLKGISFLSPILLTLPVGVMLALQITASKRRIFVYMFSSCIFWSAIFFVLSRWFGIQLFS